MIFDGILLFSDMDCTLLNSVHKISRENRRAIEYFMSEGGRFAFASGRAPKNLVRFFDDITPNMPAICYNGAIIHDYKTDETIYKKKLVPQVKEIAAKALKEIPEVGVVVDTEKEIYFLNHTEGINQFVEVVANTPKYTEAENIKEDWLKLSFWIRPEKIGITENFLESVDMPPETWKLRTYSWAYEVLNSKSDKGTAISEYRKLYPGCRIFAVGDNENDIGMLKNADIGFAMANAQENTKKYADVVLDSDYTQSAMVEVVERIQKMIR